MADLLTNNSPENYGDDAIVTLSPREHIRLRPGMYIGKLGDGSQADDGIYVLIKEVVDNSVDEFIMGAGHQVDITIEDRVVTVRDYGRGIPLKSLSAAVSEMNTGGKYGGSAFKKTVGLNGVGVKAVNMLSSEFEARSVRDGEARTVTFAKGLEQSDRWESGVGEPNGTLIRFRVDEEVFGPYDYNLEYVEQLVRNYTYLNLGLTFNFNGTAYVSKNGLLDLLNENMTEDPLDEGDLQVQAHPPDGTEGAQPLNDHSLGLLHHLDVRGKYAQDDDDDEQDDDGSHDAADVDGPGQC